MSYRLFENLLGSPAKLDKRDHEELLAKMCLKIETNFSSDTNWKALDKMYETKPTLDASTKKVIQNIISDMDTIAEKVGILKKKMTSAQISALADIIYCLREECGYLIADSLGLYTWFLEQDAYFTTVADGVPTGEDAEKAYTKWMAKYQNAPFYNKIRYVFAEALKLELPDLEKTGIIKRARTNQDTFTFEDKKKLYTLQEARDRTGAKIDILDLYLSKYEGDHMTAVKDGGPTTLANGELMKKEDNRAKGSKSNAPHFPHQVPLPLAE
jgi:hypothetical protein